MAVDTELQKHLTYILESARVAWDARRDFRVRRARSRNYYRNRPTDKVFDPETNQWITEDEYLIKTGRESSRVNQIRPIIMALKGQFRMNKTDRMAYARTREDNEGAEMMTEAMRIVADLNRTDEVDVDQFEESLVSGVYGWKTGYKWLHRYQRPEVTIEPVDPVTMILPTALDDRRLERVKMMGQIHDLELDEVISQFAKSPADAKRIKQIYQDVKDQVLYSVNVGFARKDQLDFYYPADPLLCRVIEVWMYEYDWQTFIHDPATATYGIQDVSDEEIAMVNLSRMQAVEQQALDSLPLVKKYTRYEGRWRVYYLSPKGDLLHFSENVYWHKQHPYDVGFANMFDGEIWGMVEDVIDQQRLINRLTTALDSMWASSAKGVLLLPQEAIPEGKTPDDFASEWTKFNGVIAYRAKPGMPVPQQVVAQSVPVGIFNWLANVTQNLREVSGVVGAVQGLTPQSGTPNALYQQQIVQAQMTNRDYFDAFFAVRRQRDLKVAQLIAQYYEDQRYLPAQARRPDGKRGIIYDPAKVRDLEFNVVVSDTADTPAYRQQMEEYLTGLLQTNRLTFRQYLQVSSHPKADMILQLIDRTNPLLAEQQMNPQMLAQLSAQLQMAAEAGDPDATALLTQAQ